MPIASICPDQKTLGLLIEGSLPDSELQRWTDHLGDCESCQMAIQTIATGAIAIDSYVGELGEINPPEESSYWKALKDLEADLKTSAETQSLADTQAPSGEGHNVDRGIGDEIARPNSLIADEQNASNEFPFLEPSSDPAFIGQLHHFQIARVIGRGGMGIVLEAFDTHLQRNVAIKVLNPQIQQNEIARQRFCREGRAAAAISHEHVVSMHHVAKANEGEIAYLVMQLIEGETLEHRLVDGRPLLAKEVARIGMQIAAGLSAAHSRDMVHRDIKPANILIEAETERVKLTDFGLARATDDIKLTKTGMVAGTPLYMAPEQAMGGTTDERSDLFSMGAVMYEMATGISPFQAASAVGVMKKIMDEMPTPPHKLNPEISKPLSDLIIALLAKKPEDRPESSASIATVLAGLVSEFGPISPLQVPVVTANEAKKLSGNHDVVGRRWVIGAWVSGGIATLAILILGLTFLFQPEKTEVEASEFPSVLLAGNPGTVWSVDFSRDGSDIAAAIEDGTVRLWNIESQKVVKSFNAHRGAVWMVKFHPTRPIVATCGDDSRVKLWDSTSFEMIKEWHAENTVRGISFSPNGERIIAGDREGVIHVYDIESGEKLATKSQSGSILAIDYSSDGKLIATVGNDKIVRIWDAESLTERQTMAGHDGPIYNVRFAESGSLLATVGWNKNIRIWNVETGSEVYNLEGSDGDVWGVAFCVDGKHLVTGGQDAAARVFDLADGSVIATLRGHDSAVHNIALDTDRSRIATSSRDGTIRVWDLSSLQH